jgi:4-fold beta flower protein
MTMYVYGTGGEPRGYLFETTIFGLDGAPLGRVLGSRVHRFDGSYVGEWFHQMVVERPSARPRTIPAVSPPPPRTSVAACYPRRDVAEYGNFADAFDLLVGSAPAPNVPQAAE